MSRRSFLFIFLIFSMSAIFADNVLAGASHQITKKKIQYKEHTQLDFTGEAIEGKIRSPDVFYIFQRKRSQGPQIVEVPHHLDLERTQTRQVVEKNL